MPDDLTLQMLVIPIGLFLCYAVLVAFVALRRGLRRREGGLFAGWLAVAAAWSLSSIQYGLHTIWPMLPWERVAACLLVGLGVLFWDFTRAFLQKSRLPVAAWASAGVLVVVLAALGVGLVALLPTSLAVGPITLTEVTLFPFLSAVAAAVYVCIAIVITLREYAHRPSPMHRNRIAYWLLSTIALVAGVLITLTATQPLVEIAGAGVYLVSAVMLTYAVARPHLPNVIIGVRRALSYLLAAAIPTIVTIGLGLVVTYLLGQSLFLHLPFAEAIFVSLVIAGVSVFLLHRPLGSMTRRAADRLFFGRSRDVQEVVREYSQAVTQMLSLELLTETAMQIIDDALGIQRGTLLVVEETREAGWWLRVIEGKNVAGGQPALILAAGTPLAEWLVERGAPLYQYTLDVDPRFSVIGENEREAWRRLDMEVFFPVKQSDELVGLLAIGMQRSGQPYSGEAINLLTTLADQTAVALENAALFYRAQRRAEQLALLNEIGRAIAASLNLESTVDLLARRIESAFVGNPGFIFLLDRPRDELVLQRAFGPAVQALLALASSDDSSDSPDLSFRVRSGQGLLGWVVAKGRSTIAFNLRNDSRYSPEVEGVLIPEAEAVLCVPLLGRDKTLGAILVGASSRTSFGSAELDLLDSIASFAAVAIENARQVAIREDRLRRRVRALQIEIDEIKRRRHVAEITETDYFRDLQIQARKLRQLREDEDVRAVGHPLAEEQSAVMEPQEGRAQEEEDHEVVVAEKDEKD